METGKYLEPKEAAELLGVSAHTVRRWADDGKLHATKTLGGHRRYLRDEILELVDGEEST